VIVAVLVTAVIALVASAAVAGGLSDRSSSGDASGGPSGAVVNISLTDSGGPMGEGNGPMHPGAMGLNADRATVPHGAVSFLVTNAGAVKHEMVILPMADSQVVGTAPLAAMPRSTRLGARVKHPAPVVSALARESHRAPQAE